MQPQLAPPQGRRHRLRPSASTAWAVEVLLAQERGEGTRHVLIPRPQVDLIVRVGPAVPGGVDAHAVGPRSQVRRKVLSGVGWTVTARLRLGASEATLGVPAAALADRIVPLGELWGEGAARRLLDQLGGNGDGRALAAVVEGAIEERLATCAPPLRRSAALALEAASRLGAPALASVGVIAQDLGVSERHLRRLVREAFGVGPKSLARLARFRRALRLAQRNDDVGWARVAAAAGYYDQAHLIADFRAIAGATPRTLLDELRAAASVG